MLVRKMMMFLDVCPKLIYEGVPAFGVAHIYNWYSTAPAILLVQIELPVHRSSTVSPNHST